MTLPIAMQAAGSLSQGVSGVLSSVFQGQVARNNAKIAQANEAYAASAGAANTEREGLKARQGLAGTRAGLAARNVNVNSGSAADTQVSEREIGALDQATVASNAALQAYGYRSQWSSYENQAHVEDVAAVMAALKTATAVGGDLSNLPSGGAPQPDNQGGSDLDPSLLSEASATPEAYQWMTETGALGVGG